MSRLVEADLQAKFLPAFVTSARSRVADALVVVESGDRGALLGVVRQLHALAGEAGLLGLRPLMALARGAEEVATRTHASRLESDAAAFVSGSFVR